MGVLKIMCGSDLEPLTRHRRVVPFQTVTTVPPTQKGHLTVSLALEVAAGFEPADNGVADRGLTTWLRYHKKVGADYGARTRHLRLGKATLYQMS